MVQPSVSTTNLADSSANGQRESPVRFVGVGAGE
jgi:hypothetical protein